MEATALRAQGWSISAIARHLGRDRHTVRDHLTGKRVPGERRRAEPDPFDRFVPYLRTFLLVAQEGTEVGLAGDDTDVYRDWFLICLGLSTVLVVAFVVAWRWPNLVGRWREERAAWAEMRAEGRRSAAP